MRWKRSRGAVSFCRRNTGSTVSARATHNWLRKYRKWRITSRCATNWLAPDEGCRKSFCGISTAPSRSANCRKPLATRATTIGPPSRSRLKNWLRPPRKPLPSLRKPRRACCGRRRILPAAGSTTSGYRGRLERHGESCGHDAIHCRPRHGRCWLIPIDASGRPSGAMVCSQLGQGAGFDLPGRLARISQSKGCIGPKNLRIFFSYKELPDSRTGSDANTLYL